MHSVSLHKITRQCLFVVFALSCLWFGAAEVRAQSWTAKLDDTVRFYQATDVGAVVVGTKKSLYAIDGMTGDVLWRRKDSSLDENDVAPVPGTDLLLLSFEKGERTRIEAIDILSGERIWQSDKLRGALMQMSVEADSNLLSVVLVRDAKGHSGDNLKRHPVVHTLDLSTGDERWKQEIGSDIEMMPGRWDEKDEVEFSLDNYHPPVFLNGRLFLFYEGVTSYDASSGKARTREKFRVNEEGLALTEAAPAFDEGFIYTSGRGHVRAISRASGDTEWEAKDLGLTPEIVLAGRILFARTGGQFTRLKNGETIERGPFGVTAIDARSGKILWRYKGADKGITNLVFPDAETVVIADHDDLITINTADGKRRSRTPHGIKQASFALLNDRGEIVIGGQEQIAGFDARTGQAVWRGRYPPPGRGLLRTITAIAARAASLYFRFGGVASVAFRGIQIARSVVALSSVTSVSWSGLATRSSFSNLQTLATNAGRSYANGRFKAFGVMAKVRQARGAASADLGAGIRQRLAQQRPHNVEERLLDRLDPAHQLERLSSFLWHRERLATLRGNWMYFYTDLKDIGGHGLAGVNIQTGDRDRAVRLDDLDTRFVTDEATGLLYSASSNRMIGYAVGGRQAKGSVSLLTLR
jgi:outer membrane protein assembly factor BamB